MTDDLLLADGFDEAFIGVGQRCSRPDVSVYDVSQMIRILMDRDGMSEEDAREYLEFNTFGAWVGEQTPLFVEMKTLADVREDE
mgnify:FL=1